MNGDVSILAGNLGTELAGETSEVVVLEAIASALHEFTMRADHPYSEIELAVELLQRLAVIAAGEQRCRSCGCTQDSGCVEGCSWVEEDLCSACTPASPARES